MAGVLKMAEGIIRCGQCSAVMGTFSHERISQPSVVAALVESGIFRCRKCAMELNDQEMKALSDNLEAVHAGDKEAFRAQSDVIGGVQSGGD